MRPIPVPQAIVWPGARRLVMSAPNGDLTDPTIAPVEAILDHPDSLGGAPRFTVVCTPEPGDLDTLTAGGLLAVAFWGGIPPFCVDVLAPVPPIPGSRR
jgi:hypothetical protein